MKIVIIGNGISGITAARYLRKHSDNDILVISGETDFFFSRTALMYIYMGHMEYQNTKPYEDWFWQKNRIDLLRDWITGIDSNNKQIVRSNGSRVNYDKLIIACGSKSNLFGWPGQDLDGVQSLYSYQDLQQLEQNTNREIDRAVIVGGGLIGIELAEMLHSRNIPTTLLVLEKSYWDNVLPAGESDMINRHIREHGFDLRLSEELEEIQAGEDGRVKAIKTKSGESIDTQLVCLTTGVSPNIAWLANSGIETNRGVMINRKFESNIQDIYAIGDCAEFKDPPAGRRNIEQVWYTGRMHGEILAKNIAKPASQSDYNPGPWFNSAKFLDIEYQTYGMVYPKNRDNESSFYWEDDDGKRCVHMVYDNDSTVLKGVNLFGIRARHELFHKWLKEERTLKYVVQNLGASNFDPEFYRSYEQQLLKKYNEQFNANLKLKKKGFSAFLNLIKS